MSSASGGAGAGGSAGGSSAVRSFRTPQQPVQTRGFGMSYSVLHGVGITSDDLQIFDRVFRHQGVTEEQFKMLLRHGTKCRAGAGAVLVPSGKPFDKFLLVVSGKAVAHEPPAEEGGEVGRILCQYVGKLEQDSEVEHTEDGSLVPVRGSVIGGSALVHESAVGRPYPMHIMAGTDIQYIEWDLEAISTLIRAPKMRALQASLFQMLYTELIDTLFRDRVVKQAEKEKAGSLPPAPPPSTSQLIQLSLFVGIPFFGFGLADNCIMIVCGDLIDSTFGAMLGLSTMAAAGLGNWVSDTVGLGLGDAIERSVIAMGMTGGALTPSQERMKSAKLVTLSSKIIGITIGCFVGMIPLVFLTSKKKEFANDDLVLFDDLFSQSGMTTSQFSDLLELGTRQSANKGDTLVQAGAPINKFIIVLRGEAQGYDDHHEATTKYKGRLDRSSASSSERSAGARGSLIGAKGFLEPDFESTPYPTDIVASTSIEWIEWKLEDLQTLVSKDPNMRGALMSAMYREIVHKVKAERSTVSKAQYRDLVAAVVADNKIDAKEREFLLGHKKSMRISDEDHKKILRDLGWTLDAFDRGYSSTSLGFDSEAESDGLLKCAAVLEKAARNMRS